MKKYQWDTKLKRSVELPEEPSNQAAAPSETVPATAYKVLDEERERLEKIIDERNTAIEALDKVLRALSQEELKAAAVSAGVDIGRATTLDGIMEKILAAPPDTGDGDGT